MTKKKTKKAACKKSVYNSDENSFRLYLEEISRIPLLGKEDEEKLAKLAGQGNKAAREKLINSNLRFVVAVAKKYQGRGLPLQDLISEGNLGLLTAVNHFDTEKGYRFITYAVWWIRQTIIKAINEKGRMIRLPCNKATEMMLIEKTRQTIQHEAGYELQKDIRKAALLLDMSPEKAEDLMRIGSETLSLDEPVSESENPVTVKDLIQDKDIKSPDEDAMNNILRREVETVLTDLGERAAEVIRSRFGLGDEGSLTLKEISDRYQLSRERIRQIEKRALVQLKDSVCCGKLRSYIA